MKKIIIYNAIDENNLEEIHSYLKNFNRYIRVNAHIWIVDGGASVADIKNYLITKIGVNESILVFDIANEWAIANHIDVSDWLEEGE